MDNSKAIEVTKKPSAFPCKDCGDRHDGCHSECERYLQAKAENENHKQQERKQIEKNLNYIRYIKDHTEWRRRNKI